MELIYLKESNTLVEFDYKSTNKLEFKSIKRLNRQTLSDKSDLFKKCWKKYAKIWLLEPNKTPKYETESNIDELKDEIVHNVLFMLGQYVYGTNCKTFQSDKNILSKNLHN